MSCQARCCNARVHFRDISGNVQESELIPSPRPAANSITSHLVTRPWSSRQESPSQKGPEPTASQSKAGSAAVPGARPLTSHTSLAALLDGLNTHDDDPESPVTASRGCSKLRPTRIATGQAQQQKLEAFVHTGSPLVRTPTELEMDAILHGSSLPDSIPADNNIHAAEPQRRAGPDQSSGQVSGNTALHGRPDEHGQRGLGSDKTDNLPRLEPTSGVASSRPRRLTAAAAQNRKGSSIESVPDAAGLLHGEAHRPELSHHSDSSDGDFESKADSLDAESDSSAEYIEHRLDGAAAAAHSKPSRWHRKPANARVVTSSPLRSEMSLRQRHTGSKSPTDEAAIAAATAGFSQAASSDAQAASAYAPAASSYQQSSYQQSLLSARSSLSSVQDMQDGSQPADQSSSSRMAEGQGTMDTHDGRQAGSLLCHGEDSGDGVKADSSPPAESNGAHDLPSPSFEKADSKMQLQASHGIPDGTAMPSHAEPQYPSSQPGQQRDATEQQGRLLSPQVSLLVSPLNGCLDGEQGMADVDPEGDGHEASDLLDPSSRALQPGPDPVFPEPLAKGPTSSQTSAEHVYGTVVHQQARQLQADGEPSSQAAFATPSSPTQPKASSIHEAAPPVQSSQASVNGPDLAQTDVAHGHQQHLGIDPIPVPLPGDQANQTLQSSHEVEAQTQASPRQSASAASISTQAGQLQRPEDTDVPVSQQSSIPESASTYQLGTPSGTPLADQAGAETASAAIVHSAGQNSLHIHVTPAQGPMQHMAPAKPPTSPSRLKHQTAADDFGEHAQLLGPPPSPFGQNGGLAKPRDMGRAESAEPALLLGRPSDAEGGDDGQGSGEASQMPAAATPGVAQRTAVGLPVPPSSFLPALTAQDSTQQQAAAKPGTVSSHPIGESDTIQ